MALKFCPLSCAARKSKQNCIVSKDEVADASSVVWHTLCPMVFCSEVFPPNSIRNEKPREMSKTCWYCHEDSNISGKFVTKKSTDPIPKKIRNVQEKLGYIPGEPITKYNFHKIIPAVGRKPKSNSESSGTYESSRQAKETTPLQTASLKGLAGLKRKCENSGYAPFKKYAGGSYDSTAPKANSQYRAFEYKSMKSNLNFGSKGIASV